MHKENNKVLLEKYFEVDLDSDTAWLGLAEKLGLSCDILWCVDLAVLIDIARKVK